MILYDQNYNFIGMSNETLSYLGYEDLSDFTSQHSDFANLLVNKEGYIYKFENFSWIDFVLFSGAPNKSAILKLKSGEEMEIKVSVKEVFLTNDLNGNKKFYSIRILSDNFVNVASKTDATITKKSPPKNAFNLNSLIADDTAPVTKEEVQPSPKESMKTEEPKEKSDGFILNFPSDDDLIKKEEPSIKLDLTNKVQEDFVLKAPKDEVRADENGFKLKLSESPFASTEPEPAEASSEKKDFLLNINKEEKKEEKEEKTIHFNLLSKESEEERVGTDTMHFKRKHIEEEISMPGAKEEKPEKITLNFLKQEPVEQPKVEETVSIETPVDTPTMGGLDFLKKSIDSDMPEPVAEKKEQIIAQIKNDLQEIDEVPQAPSTLSINHEAQEDTSTDLNAYLFNQDEAKEDKKSFTKTLASLFEQTQPQESTDERFLDETLAPEATLKKNDKKEQTASLSTLISDTEPAQTASSLGLDKEEEDALVLEFIQDAKINIETFKEFQKSANGAQAEYTLIKMQSSASILNLNAIISILDEIKISYKDGVSEKIESLIGTLETEIATIERSLEHEMV